MTADYKPTAAEKIRDAESAAPRAIGANARILDAPAMKGGPRAELRAGTNGWTCMPRMRKQGVPMCYDANAMRWAQAIASRSKFEITGVGITYMLQGAPAGSTTSPYETAKTATNDWGVDGPSLMLILPDPAAYAGLPTKRTNGPYVMYAGTPYAHIMLPVDARR